MKQEVLQKFTFCEFCFSNCWCFLIESLKEYWKREKAKYSNVLWRIVELCVTLCSMLKIYVFSYLPWLCSSKLDPDEMIFSPFYFPAHGSQPPDHHPSQDPPAEEEKNQHKKKSFRFLLWQGLKSSPNLHWYYLRKYKYQLKFKFNFAFYNALGFFKNWVWNQEHFSFQTVGQTPVWSWALD